MDELMEVDALSVGRRSCGGGGKAEAWGPSCKRGKGRGREGSLTGMPFTLSSAGTSGRSGLVVLLYSVSTLTSAAGSRREHGRTSSGRQQETLETLEPYPRLFGMHGGGVMRSSPWEAEASDCGRESEYFFMDGILTSIVFL